jgi:hypothetical protein
MTTSSETSLTFDGGYSRCEWHRGEFLGELLGDGRRLQRVNLLLQFHDALSLQLDSRAITLNLNFQRAESHDDLRVFASRDRR